ncbi:hypothetical protein SNE25_26365 [Mucilaginibacter sabulilitoris]|uniref:Uncharacterized protein n=1 Tax=Mucilaginibacter sabulilitoris TaxID=1173583 RepID=A0ABZ0TL03_9SPHI|nr:hypothetical protein [Mucilaginibacter sabulilitoris]WPU92853.1 hypothetical protein SNE25_26365 [Mucilaginibacter sabulilitoris]
MGTVFMRTIAISGKDFPGLVSRVSGTADYTVKTATPDTASFTTVFRVDGHPASTLDIAISDQGRSIAFSGKRSLNHEGSGLTYNTFLWGNPPSNLKVGDTWTVNLVQPWESGGPGKQTVRVEWVNPKNHTICLRRDGDSEGFFEDEAKELTINKGGKPLKVAIVPGKTHWTGYTIFKEGLIISDELMATRNLQLCADDQIYPADEREYMMLNSRSF